MQPVGDAGLLAVGDRHAHRLRVDVRAQDAAPLARGARAAPFARLGAQPFPQLRIVAVPPREAEIAAVERRRGIRGDQGRFGEESTRTAHGIEQQPAGVEDAGPTRAQQHRRGDVLLERRAAALAAVAAPMQALAGEIHRQQRGGSFHVQMQQHVGAFRFDVRPLAGGVAQVVADRILEQLRAVDRVPDGFVAAAAVAGQRRAGREMLAPVDAFDGFIDAFRAAGVDRSQAQQHAGGGSRPQAGTVAHLERALKLDVVAALADVGGAELRQFLGQHRRRAHRRRRDPVADVVAHAQFVISRKLSQSSRGWFEKYRTRIR